MYLLLFLVIFIITYIVSFKDSFKAENLEKVKPVICIIAFLVSLVFIVNCILGGV